VHLANPAAMKQYEGIKYIDDKSDAFWLAKMLKLGILPEGYIYPREGRGTRDLLRQRSRYVMQKTSLKHTLQQIVCNQTGITLSNNLINLICPYAEPKGVGPLSVSLEMGPKKFEWTCAWYRKISGTA